MDIADAQSTETTPRRKRGGRAAVAADAALVARISAACTVADREHVQAAAAACGLTVSEFLVRAARGVRAPAPVVPREWRQVWSDLAPMSSNLHMLARHLNFKAAAGEIEDAGTYDQLLQLVPQLAQQLRQLRQALVPTR